MPVIKINEVSKFPLPGVSNDTNSVVVPVLMKEGPDGSIADSYETVLITNKAELDEVCPTAKRFDLDTSFDYVEGLLDSGLEIILERINLRSKDITSNTVITAVLKFFESGTTNDSRINPSATVYYVENLNETNVEEFYEYYLSDGGFDKFRDRSVFNFRFITIGNHASAYIRGGEVVGAYKSLRGLVGSAAEMTATSGRGDALAIIDFQKNISRKGSTNIYTLLENYSTAEEDKDCAITYPWVGKFTGGYAYLCAFANSSKSYPSHYAVAGYSRGTINGIPNEILGEIDMHILQQDSFNTKTTGYAPKAIVNPIIKCSDGIFRIWGNRPVKKQDNIDTIDDTTDVSLFLNVRHLIYSIKKQLYVASNHFTFDPNDDTTWFNFQMVCKPLLDKLIVTRGMKSYQWKKEKTNKKGFIKASLIIEPIEPVESFDLTVLVNSISQEVSVEE